jgi:hypothetical protein
LIAALSADRSHEMTGQQMENDCTCLTLAHSGLLVCDVCGIAADTAVPVFAAMWCMLQVYLERAELLRKLQGR